MSRYNIKSIFLGKSNLIAKIAVSSVAFISGIGFLLLFVYAFIPGLVSDTAEMIDYDFAVELYEKTLVTDNAAQVFEQSDEADTKVSPRDCFSSVLAYNPDITGRISINSLGITYLVTQTDDNKYYLKMGYDREKSDDGAVFLDYRCDASAQPLSGHYILYGHNLKEGGLFHNLVGYKEKDVFYDNRVIRFDTLYQDHEWEVFSAYVTDTNFYFIDTVFDSDDEWIDFMHEIQQKSMYETDIELCAGDVILTLCTCSFEFDDARFVIHARLIE